MKKPLFSVITPTYNVERSIERCISSIKDQTFTDFEHIVVDGQSTDRTIALLKKYQGECSNVTLIVEKDGGVYDAMNKGIRIASADWLYFIGADDFFFDKYSLEKVAGFVAGNKSQLVYGDVFFEGLLRLYDGKFSIEKILTRNICHQSIFYHTSTFNALGYYDLRYRIHADYDFNIKCWLSGKIRHTYIPVTVCSFSDGGLSALQPDPLFIKDFPEKTVDLLFGSDLRLPEKIVVLSTIYRKIVQRYSLRVLRKLIWRKSRMGLNAVAILWLVLSSPFYIVRKYTTQK